MNLSPSAQATLLMTSHFGKTSTDGQRPLSIVEWGRFAMWLKDQAATPEDLLRLNVSCSVSPKSYVPVATASGGRVSLPLPKANSCHTDVQLTLQAEVIGTSTQGYFSPTN